jgi:TonB family protein
METSATRPRMLLATCAALFCLGGAQTTAQAPAASAIPPCAGGDFKYPDRMVRPKYPLKASPDRVGVGVELEVTVTPAGKIRQILPSDGANPFIRAAIEAVRKWHFYSVERKGRAIETTYRVHLHFNSVLLEAVPTGIEVASPQPEQPSLADDIDQKDTADEVTYKSSDPEVIAPRATYSPQPAFAEEARKGALQGRVGVLMIVEKDGTPSHLRIWCSSIPEQNQITLETLKLWKFSPGNKNGEPVRVRIAVETSFHQF